MLSAQAVFGGQRGGGNLAKLYTVSTSFKFFGWVERFLCTTSPLPAHNLCYEFSAGKPADFTDEFGGLSTVYTGSIKVITKEIYLL